MDPWSTEPSTAGDEERKGCIEVKRTNTDPSGSTRSPRPARDHGFSLVEMVVTISIMSIALVPLMFGALVLVRASSAGRNATKVETVLNNAADRVNRARETCDGYSNYVEAAAQSQGWAAGQATATYKWYEPGDSASVEGNWHAGICPDGVQAIDLVQLVTISVTSPDGKLTRSIEVVKSKI
jgi:prepilin-type N-terminal cleavage/methylation domain-containing protein